MSPMLLLLCLAPTFAQEPPPPPMPEMALEAPAAPTPPEAPQAVSVEEFRELQRELAELKAEKAAGISEEAPESSGSRVSYGSDVVVGEADIVDDVAVYGYDVIVRGRVLGDATSFGGDVIVSPGARVDGDATSFGGEVRVEEGGSVSGDRVSFADEVYAEEEVEETTTITGLLTSLYHRMVLLLSFAGAGVLLVGLVPTRITRIADMIAERPFGTFGAGALASLFLGIGSLLFAITLIGLPIAFLLLAVLGLAWLMGFVALCQALGDRLPFQQKHHGRWLAFLIGTVVVTFFGFLPFFGGLLVVVGSLVGIGAAVATAFGSR